MAKSQTQLTLSRAQLIFTPFNNTQHFARQCVWTARRVD
eukprot:SAG25_NODE_6273_length_573_cov_0.763713_2_plen_38_part_01